MSSSSPEERCDGGRRRQEDSSQRRGSRRDQRPRQTGLVAGPVIVMYTSPGGRGVNGAQAEAFASVTPSFCSFTLEIKTHTSVISSDHWNVESQPEQRWFPSHSSSTPTPDELRKMA